MKTVKLKPPKSRVETLRELLMGTHSSEPVQSIFLVGPGYVGGEFLRLVSHGYMCKIAGVMDSKYALICEEGINPAEAIYIYQIKENRNDGKKLNEVRIPGKKLKFYEVPTDKEKIEILEDPNVVYSQLVLATSSSNEQAKQNKRLVDAAIKRKANINLAVKNVLNNTNTYNRIMRELKRKDYKGYITYAAACGVEASIPDTILNYINSGDIHIEMVGNASSNMFIYLLEEGFEPDNAIKKLKELGSLEPDPDVSISGEGLDLFNKTRIVENTIRYKLGGVIKSNLRSPTFDENTIEAYVDAAKKKGMKVKLVATIDVKKWSGKPEIVSDIGFKEIYKTDPLAQINELYCGYVCTVAGVQQPVQKGLGAGKVTGWRLYQDSKTIWRTALAEKDSGVYTGPLISSK